MAFKRVIIRRVGPLSWLLGDLKSMHARLEIISKKLRHAEALATTRGNDVTKRFSQNHAYRTCFIRLSNKAKYAAEIIEFYSNSVPSERELANDHVERVIETEKWFLVGALSVIEYSMPSFLGDRGSKKLRDTASNGPFAVFLDKAESEKAMDTNEKSLFEFLSRIRNDLIHRNGVSREDARMIFQETSFELVKDEMIEGHWGMLTDLGTLAIYAVAGIIDDIEQHLGRDADS